MPSHEEIQKEKKHLEQIAHKIAEPTCCICVPYRLGVFLNAGATIFMSCMVLFGKNFPGFEASVRQIYGGYTLYSKICVGALEVSGIVWGIIGMSGAIRNSASQIFIFLMYQVVRVSLWLVVYCLDVPELWYCEDWTNNISKKLKEGWNPTMYTVALNGRCFQERIIFCVFSLLALCFFIYLTFVNYKFYKKLQHELTYKLDTKNESVGMWYTRSAHHFNQDSENAADWTHVRGDDPEVSTGTYFMVEGQGSEHKRHVDAGHDLQAPKQQGFSLRSKLPKPTGFVGENFEAASNQPMQFHPSMPPRLGEQTPLMTGMGSLPPQQMQGTQHGGRGVPGSHLHYGHH